MIDEPNSDEQKQAEDESGTPDTNDEPVDGGNDTESFDLNEGGESEDIDPEEEDELNDEEMPDLSGMLPPTDVLSLSQLFISMLANSAWQYLGLIPDPKTNKIGKDIKQAGQAIDIIEFIHGKMRDDMEKEFVTGVDDLLANLRINFVTKSGEE
jgi:hypothetical protein